MVTKKRQKQSIKSKTRRKMFAQQHEMDRILKEIEDRLDEHIGSFAKSDVRTNIESIGGVLGRTGYSFRIEFSAPAWVSKTIEEMAKYDPADIYARGSPAYRRGTFKYAAGIHCTIETVDREVKRAIHSFRNEFKSRAKPITEDE